MVLLLMAGGAWNVSRATDVTYHILTLPIDTSIYHLKEDFHGWRLEAVKVVEKGQSTLELPAQYKSPLATGFTYYRASDITKYNNGTVQNLFKNGPIKGVLYKVNGVDADTEGTSSAVGEGTMLSGANAEYYVVYQYKADTIAKLDGSVRYNIRTKYKDKNTWKDKGFMALNRGRNNRPALLPTANVDPEMLASEDFMKVSVDGTGVSPYWKDNNNRNKEADVAGQFYFMFKFIGEDPYNILIRTAYTKDSTYIEKNDGTNDFVYKWYKEGSLLAVSAGNNCYIASDEHKKYNLIHNAGTYPTNPTNLEEGAGRGFIYRPGNYHGQTGVVWNTFALLNNSNNDGYVFMGTRTVDGSGAINNIYYLKEKDNRNNLNFATGNSTDNLSIEGIYPIERVTFKVATSFYDSLSPTEHIISVPDWVSLYTVENDPIETKYLPAALNRKYCTFNGLFYKDAARKIPITHFSQATKHPTEGYQVYVGYSVSPSAPKFLSPSSSYTTATWYELTDEGSVQESGRKIKNNSGTYKNNGANGTYEKESEFAFVGDPYELKVLYRKGTEDAKANQYVTLSTYDTWDMPDDKTVGSFLLRKYNDTGYWRWDAGQASVAVTYPNEGSASVDKDAHTVTINLTGLNGSKYYKITTGGTDAGQIVSVTPEVDNVTKETGSALTVVVSLAANTSGEEKTMTVSIQEYNDAEGNTPVVTPANPSVITITQGTGTTAFAGNEVTYNTDNPPTRVKVLTLPTRTYTYNIVDRSGSIAVKASKQQTIFSALSLASVPSIIVSPLISDERVTFYDSYTDRNGDSKRTRLDFHYDTGGSSEQDSILETPNTDHDIFVTYTTVKLNNKPINISENQEFNVVLNGHYLWYDSVGNAVKTAEAPSTGDLKKKVYLWKLRNRDPYAMLVDNLGAREDSDFKVADQWETVTVYDDRGTETTDSRQKGAWVDLASIANGVPIIFTTSRAEAQPFVAKASVQTGVYEVMVATGTSVDASTTYYNIGSPSENTVEIYHNDVENGGYAHGNDVLKFHLEQSTPYTYYLIDKAKHKLLTLTSQNPDLTLPADYQSPLATYKYYAANNIRIADKGTPAKSDDEYTPIDTAATLGTLADLEVAYTGPTSCEPEVWEGKENLDPYKKTATDETDMLSQVRLLDSVGVCVFRLGESGSYTYQTVNVTRGYRGRAIYVTYTKIDSIPFGTGHPYTLKFLEPFAEGYFLEDGADKLTTNKIKAVYPYCNGDGNLNVYGAGMQTEQFGGGASTRPRWIWYFDSENDDPYHVRIRSRSTISYNSVSHPTYLTTYAVRFNQDTKDTLRVVTGGTLPGVASVEPTEYMIVGSLGAFKLMTTDSIDDGVTKERRKVTSLEQYWKTYNMLKLDVLGLSATTDNFEGPWEVPTVDDPETAGEDESTYRTIIEAKGWHSYDAYANATRWNGFNDKSDGHEKKVVEKLEHWFQTFNMGNGTFQIESADIPPVLVLLDLHGWEIMRLPLPTVNYPEGDDELAALRAYDSPLVKEYKFYSQATKASGCHKYTLRLDDKTKAERDQIKVGGVHYTSPSLGDLPPITASGVKSSGAFNDQFVTYTVKEEYAKSCTYSVELNEEDTTYSETLTASKFLVLLRSRFLRDNGSDSGSSYNSKPIYEASQPVGGSAYDAILDPQRETHSNVSTAVDVSPQDGKIDDINLWYLQPNLDIDKEMGIKWGTSIDTTKAEPLSEFGTKKKYYNRSGFDPYNIQLRNAANDKFLTAHQTSTRLDNGILIGDYSGVGGTTDITLETKVSYDGVDPMDPTGSVGYDHTNLKISNQTFMAVSDASGNMQLMPRFDHTKRVNLVNNSQYSYTTLQNPVNHPKASVTDNSSMGTQTVFFVRPQVFEYRIIDNDGKESLRYKRSGDYYPAITDHFMSPIATNFTYYKGLAVHGDTTGCTVQEWARAGKYQRSLTAESMMLDALNLLPDTGTYYYRIGTRGQFIYRKVTVTKGLLEQQITGSFAAAGLNGDDCNVIVRYEYNAGHDLESDKILQGKWFTVKLANKDLQASGTVVAATDETQGTGVDLYAGDKTGASPINGALEKRKWQWKFVATLADPVSDYYEEPDPYAVHIFNRQANYTNDPSTEPNPMNTGIKVPKANDGADRFALLSHSEGGYALAKAGTQTYNYEFVNGADMTAPDAGEPVPATIVEETGFTQKAGIFSGVGSLLLVEDDVEHNFTYKVINNGGANYVVDNPGNLAVEATQDNDEADAHQFSPYLPESAQTPLLRDKVDYKYYGFAIPAGPKYKVISQTILYTLYGLYDDVVWVRYNAYNMDSTEFKVPNDKAIVGGHVARGEDSHDVSMNIEGALPYNIIWYDDNMMSTNEGDTEIDEVVGHDLDGDHKYVWYFEGNDPYALRIKHKLTGGYVDGSTALTDSAGAKLFMLLKKDGHEYGILQVTGTTGEDAGKKLTGFGGALTGDAITDPTKFVIFGLSVHDLIYRLIIAKTCTKEEESNPDLDPSKYVDIPYRAIESGDLTELRVFGSTQRDLESYKDPSDPKRVVGDKYQLGDTVRWGGAVHTYSHDAGAVSIGDVLEVPNVFNRPNCTFEYYIEGIYNTAGTTPEATLNSKYKGLKVDKLMPSSDLIDKTVVVNIVYSFNKDLATNTGLDFVRDVDQNLWYTFETQGGSKPYLAHYTNAWGMQSMEGRETRYTNDYLWTPLGDVYGFKMYNRYMIKNSGADDKVMTYAGDASAGKRLVVAKPGDDADVGTYTAGNEIFELLKGDADGYFRVHPVVNTGETKYFVVRNADADNYTELSSSVSPSSSDWAFGLDMTLLEPYYVRAGYVGGLTATAKAAYKAEIDKGEGKYKITDLQNIVYADSNIVSFSKGYYRLHSVPGTPGISPVRYASGYLHEIERDQNGDDDEADAIPMHFYSKAGVTGTFDGEVNPLRSGFTETHATRGDIPVPATEDDPSTIFYLDGAIDTEDRLDSVNPRVIMSTQGLYVKGKVGKKVVDEEEVDDPDHGNVVMTATQGEATKFSLIDIGGAVLLITNELAPGTRNYMHYGQEAPIYNLKYFHNSPTNEARWCVEPANNQGLEIATNNGGDGYYYTTFYAPFDVLLPADADGHTYNAYTSNTWHDKGVHPTPVPANTYSEGKFIPAQTPVIIRTNDESGSVTMTLPSTEPSAPISSCVFTGKYLEQMLPLDAGNQWQYDVYTLGLPMTSDVEKDKEDYNSTGDITAPLAEFDDAGVGFYINATPNKEHDALKSMWLRNNRYILHNKIYFRATGGGGGGAPDHTRGTDFVPVLFDDEGGEDEPGSQDENGNNRRTGDGCVYDLLGRKVAAAADIQAGTCYLSPGIYIIDGKKVFVGVGR